MRLSDFEPISLDHKPLFDDYCRRFSPKHSDYTFSVNYLWRHYADYRVLEVDDHLLIHATIDGINVMKYPLGEHSNEILDAIRDMGEAEGWDHPIPLALLENDARVFVKRHYPDLRIRMNPEFHDYLYETRSLAELSGKEHQKTRNKLNRFTRTYHHDVEEISASNMSEVSAFLERWCLWRDCEGNDTLSAEQESINQAIANWDALGLEGLVIKVYDAVEAIAIYERISDDTVFIHYEKGDTRYEGVYQAVVNETAIHLADTVPYLNRAQDLGEPGLRQAKRSLRPSCMVEVGHICPHEEDDKHPEWTGEC